MCFVLVQGNGMYLVKCNIDLINICSDCNGVKTPNCGLILPSPWCGIFCQDNKRGKKENVNVARSAASGAICIQELNRERRGMLWKITFVLVMGVENIVLCRNLVRGNQGYSPFCSHSVLFNNTNFLLFCYLLFCDFWFLSNGDYVLDIMRPALY